MMSSTMPARRIARSLLLSGAAAIGIATAGAAQAQIADQPALDSPAAGAAAKVDGGGAVLEAHETSVVQPPRLDVIAPDPQILIAAPGTPTTARDPVNITGIGQIVVDTGNGSGSIGLCTATLINPRTVLFAAHCVNGAAATSYGRSGPNGSGTAVSIGFGTNNLPAVQQWLFAGANQYRSNPGTFLYNLNQVVYNPQSTEPGNGFLYADIAVGTLDTPARNIPTWALLFSALPAPSSITAAGTGYHVNLSGYGGNGTGITGTVGGIDFRRRIAENTLGALASLDDFQNFLFGSTGTGLPQNLYWIDFDDPRRGTAAATRFDFNAFRDNALPNEGITAPGDSGGPLILDRTFSRQVVIGVLSGGFSRFFTGQPANSYGAVSFYQPVYLYWDYIAANNPYRYVSSVAGDRNWTDPANWVTTLDPNYQIIGPNGQLVNGIPNSPGGGITNTAGKFGQACFQTTTLSDCLDFRTGVEVVNNNPIGTVADGKGSATIDALTNQPGEAVIENAATGTANNIAVLPPATIANGLPGATNFVPNNVDPVRTTGAIGRYFDVTLAATGTTTLNTAVTIDRLTIGGAGARLNIDATGSLTSLIDITQMTGTLQVNGALSTPGDFFLLTGGLNGTGTITTPFFTSTLGTISPGASGTAGSIGTLTFRGNTIFASGNLYLVDLGANGTSDRIAVQATAFNGAVPTNGVANLGGQLQFNISGTTLRGGSSYTILTAQGGVTGSFQTPLALSAILTPTLTYTANLVQLAITAGQYRNVANQSGVQSAYAQLLDQNRGNSAQFDAIYGPLDLQSAGTIRATLDSLAPRSETLVNALATAAVDNVARFHRDRLAQYDPDASIGGSIAVIGQPIQLAAANASSLAGGQPVASDTATTQYTNANLPSNVGIYLAGGYIDGSSAPMRQATPLGGRDRFDGFYIIGGIETDMGDGMVGLSFGYTELNGTVTTGTQRASGGLYQGTLYARADLGGGISMDGQVNAGLFDVGTLRNVGFVGNNFRLATNTSAFALGGEVGAQRAFPIYGFKFSPRISLRSSFVDYGLAAETGGGPALRYSRADLSSVQGRAGFNFAGGAIGHVRPFLTANYVHEFDRQRPNVVFANFVGGTGPDARFLLASVDRNWFEVSGGVTYVRGNVELSLAADSSVGRSDVDNQSYRGAIKFRF